MVQPYQIQEDSLYLTVAAFSILLFFSILVSFLLPFIAIALSLLILHLYERLWGDTIDFGAYCISLGVFVLWSYIRW
jgi:hypothetical protein